MHRRIARIARGGTRWNAVERGRVGAQVRAAPRRWLCALQPQRPAPDRRALARRAIPPGRPRGV